MADCSVTLGDNVVVIKSSGSSQAQVVPLLGIEYDQNNKPHKLHLNACIHLGNYKFSGWEAKGAITTELTKVK